jgi:hypothetical protein
MKERRSLPGMSKVQYRLKVVFPCRGLHENI